MHPRLSPRRLTVLFAAVLVAAACNEASAATLVPSRSDAAPRVDGVLDETIWRTADQASGFVQQRPDTGAPSNAQTRVRVIYTASALYIGFECDEPDSVLARSLGRDADLSQEDRFGVLIDTFNDDQNGYIFRVNPNGARTDLLVRSEGEQLNYDWDGIWKAATVVTDRGWQGEIEIPWHTLRFPRGERQDMGLNFERQRREVNEQSHWSEIPRQYSFARVSLAGELNGLEGINPGRNLQLRPYALGRTDRGDQDNPDGWAEGHWVGEGDVGVDLKYGLSSELTLDLAVNPDFAQVEVDDELVNLTRFDLEFPEKREFFLEKANLFRFGPSYNRQFYSRRIGLDEEGRTLPIWYGARMTGKVGSTNIGLLDLMQGPSRGAPRRHFDVVRVKQDVGRSSIGGMFVRRGSGDDGDLPEVDGTSYGVDADLFPSEQVFVSGYAATSDVQGAGEDDATYGARLRWSDPLYVLTLSHEMIGTDYEPPVSFVERNGVDLTALGWEFTPEPNWKWIRRFENQGFFYWIDRRHRGAESRYIHVNPVVVGQSEERLGVWWERDFERLYEPFSLGDPTDPATASFPVGDYDSDIWGVDLESDPSHWWSLAAHGVFGKLYDADQTLFNVEARVRSVPHWNLSTQYERARIERDGPLQRQRFESDVLRLRLGWDLDNAFSVDLFTQFNTTEKLVVSQLRAHYLFGDESDLYLVVSDGRSDGSRNWVTRQSEVTLKISYVMQL